MKIKPCSTKNQGSVLLVCLCFAAIIGIGLVGYLTMVQSEISNVSHSQGWNNSMVMAEGGIEEGMSLINKYVSTSTPLTNWFTTAVNDGWTQNGNVFSLTRTVPGGSYSLLVTNISNITNVSIKSTGTFNWRNDSSTPISRAILIDTYATSFFQRAMTAKTTVTLKGGPIVDSFNSGSSNYSTGGLYDPTKREAHGNIMTVQSNVVLTTDISLVGNARVYGQVITGPNDGVSMNGNATIGDTNYSGTGIQSGWTNSTSNLSIPDAPAMPSGPWLPLPPALGGTYILTGLGPGTTTYYQIPSGVSGGNFIITNGTVYLDVESNLRLTGQNSISIAANSSAVMWLNGSSADMEGGGVVNGSGLASNLIVYGTPNLTSLDLGGNSAFTGAVYAPYADITYHGGNDFTGAAIGNSFTDVGGANFHYDEALQGMVSGSYIVMSWSEITP